MNDIDEDVPTANDGGKGDPTATKPPSWVRRIVTILIIIEVGWLVLVNLFLNTPLAPWAINRKPEKWSVTWERAVTPFPARVFATGFTFEQKTPTMSVTITADEVAASVRILPFFAKTFRADVVDTGRLSVVLDRKGGAGAAAASTKTAPGFTIQLRDISVRELQEFRFDDVSIAGGEATVAGTLELQVRADLAVRDADLLWRDAKVALAGESIAESLDLEFRGGFSPFQYKVDKGLAMLAHLSGDLEVDGHVGSLVPLKIFFAGTKWVERIDGEGDVAVELEIGDGKLLPGSTIDVDADELMLDFMGFRATGSGGVDGRVKAGDEGRDATIVVLFDEFEFGRRTEEQPLAKGMGLRLKTTADDFGAAEMIEGVEVTLDLPHSEVPDITFLGRSLPESLGLAVTGGRATLAVHLEAKGGKEKAKGSFELRGDDLAGSFKDFDFEVDLEATTRISGHDWDDFEVRLKGTELKLVDGVFRHPEVDVDDGWWMTVEVPSGRANFGVPLDVEAEVDLSMRDTSVLVAMFAEIKSWIRHIDGLLTVHDVVGHAQAGLADKRISLRELSLAGENLEAMGELELAKGDRNAIFWVKFGILALGLERIGDETDWKLINAREWFEEQRAESWVSTEGEAIIPEAESDEKAESEGESAP